MPRHFSYVKLRSKLSGGKTLKIDVGGGAGKERWICESNWWVGRKIGQVEVEFLMREKSVLWSVIDNLDGLLKHVGLRQLPELAGEKIVY